MKVFNVEPQLNPIDISGIKVGASYPCMVIAEAGVNHNGSKKMALELVEIAHQAGADAVKFQLFRPEEQVSQLAKTADYQYTNTGVTNALEMSELYSLPWDSHYDIAAHCNKVGIVYMASCFDMQAVDFLLDLGGDCIKVGSGEITNYPLLGYIASKGKSIILSTGMSTFQDVEGAVQHIRRCGNTDIILLQCVSNYPATATSVNLRVMQTFTDKFGVHVGFSDHTLGNTVSGAAVALGACVIEKHFTLDKSLPGPDHAMSLDPDEFRDFVTSIRTVQDALGDGNKVVDRSELETQRVSRRSLFASRNISAGEQLKTSNVTLKRPNIGIDPRRWEEVQGRTVVNDVDADNPITRDLLS